MSKQYSVTITVEVSDDDGVIDGARDDFRAYLKARGKKTNWAGKTVEELIPDVPEALKSLFNPDVLQRVAGLELLKYDCEEIR